MKTLRLDEVAIWRAKPTDELTIRSNPAGRPYEDNNIIKKTEDVAFRYAKNYEKGDKKFCLFVFTYDDNAKAVEKFLDKVAKAVTVTQVKEINEYSVGIFGDFEWLNVKYERKEK